ncbi:MAG TPA: Ig domain-containing protein, partial [Cryptosporangiaceae bacterium]|nr:Ig domain-containing protein [Cryptosporangiaceae bacterium]
NKGTKWGDIFSHRKNNTTNGQLRQVNWPAGQTLFEGATFTYNGQSRQACRTLTTTEYIRSEHEAGVPLRTVMADLDEQQASEDLALRTALGKSFTAWFDEDPTRSVDDLVAGLELQMPSATTGAATAVTSTSATLNGTVDTKGAQASLFFDHGTDPALGTATSTAALPASATGAETATLTLTGLAPATTYFYRLVASVVSGSGDAATEQDVTGSIRSFTTAGVNAPVVTTEVLPAAQVGQPYEAPLAASDGTLPYADWIAAPLPAGLALNAATGVISGTPADPGTVDVVVSVAGANAARSATREVALTVLPAATPPGKAARTLSLEVDHAVLGPGAVATFSARASAGGGTISYTLVSGGSSCDLDGPQLTATAVVTCEVSAHIAEDDAHEAATSAAVSVSFATVDPDAPPNVITFESLDDRTVGATPFGVTATATSGLPVTFTSETPAVCTVTGTTVSVVAASVCRITAAQPGGDLPDGGGTAPPAVSVTRSFNVVKRPNVLHFPVLEDRVVGAAPFDAPVTSSAGLPAHLVSETPDVCTTDGLTVTIVGAGTCALVASQPGDDAVAPAQPVGRTFVVAPAADRDTSRD